MLFSASKHNCSVIMQQEHWGNYYTRLPCYKIHFVFEEKWEKWPYKTVEKNNSNVGYIFARSQRRVVHSTIIYSKGAMNFNCPTEINLLWATCSKERTPVVKCCGNLREGVLISEGSNEHQYFSFVGCISNFNELCVKINFSGAMYSMIKPPFFKKSFRSQIFSSQPLSRLLFFYYSLCCSQRIREMGKS